MARFLDTVVVSDTSQSFAARFLDTVVVSDASQSFAARFLDTVVVSDTSQSFAARFLDAVVVSDPLKGEGPPEFKNASKNWKPAAGRKRPGTIVGK